MVKSRKNPTSSKSKIYKYILRLLLLIFFILAALFFIQKTVLVNSDIGRHIKNGEVLVKQGTIISTNFYSYTEPDFPVINHHLGSGVLYYFAYSMFDFEGLTVFNTLVFLLGLMFIIMASIKRAGILYTLLIGIFSLTLISSRVEIRPEVISLFFLGVFYYILTAFHNNEISAKKTYILIPLMILWVNLHIFFVFGLFLIGVYMFCSLLQSRQKKTNTHYIILLCISILASLANPHGIWGVVEPFLIFREYGYMVAENQSVFFMQDRVPDYLLYIHFEILAISSLLCYVLILRRKNFYQHLPGLLILLVFGTFAFLLVRIIPVFAFFAIAVLPAVVMEVRKKLFKDKASGILRIITITFIVTLMMINFFSKSYYLSPFKKSFGFGLYKYMNNSVNFFKINNIKGPIFNNYDVGGYLIFHLFPENRVFVDNRPEAYSVGFFKNIYEPMLEHDAVWETYDNKYDFNCIFFFRKDNTQFGQPFLIRRLNDKNWAPVFVDDVNIILLKRNQKNHELIKQYELPESMFSARQVRSP